MKFERKTQRGWVNGALTICLGSLLAAGCGGESTQPKPEVTVMGGVLLAHGIPAGTPYQVGAVVSVDGQAVTDAEVRINGAGMTYVVNPTMPEQTGYIGQVSASRGDVLTLSATAAGQTVTLQAAVPGMVEIHPLTGGLVYGDNQDISITWEPAVDAVLTIIACGSANSTTPGMWLVAPSASAHTIPASATTVPGNRISVMGISGMGDLPSTMDFRQWAGRNGFWVTAQDYIDVMITD